MRILWNVVSYKPFIHRVVPAATKEEAIKLAFKHLEGHHLLDENKLLQHILSKEDDSYVAQICLPKEAKQFFAGQLVQLLAEVECEAFKRKLAEEYYAKVAALIKFLDIIEEYYEDKGIGQIRQTAELLLNHRPSTSIKECRSYDYYEFSPEENNTIHDLLIQAIMADPVQ